MINELLISLEILAEETRLNLLIEEGLVWILQTSFGVWKGLGCGSIVYFAAIAGSDMEHIR